MALLGVEQSVCEHRIVAFASDVAFVLSEHCEVEFEIMPDLCQ